MKLTKAKLKQIIREELSNVMSYAGTQIHIKESRVLEGGKTLEALVKEEFEVWREEQKANRNKFQPGLGSGGNEGKAATHRYEVFDKVKRTLIQNHGFMDGLAAYKLKKVGEQYDEEKVIDVGTPIYKEIYTILYDLIPRPRR